MMSYLAGGRVGDAPHGGDHRQGPGGLVGGLLPAGRVVGVRPVAVETESVVMAARAGHIRPGLGSDRNQNRTYLWGLAPRPLFIWFSGFMADGTGGPIRQTEPWRTETDCVELRFPSATWGPLSTNQNQFLLQ